MDESERANKLTVEGLSFKAADYAVFIGLLLLAAGLGVYSGIVEIRRKRKDTAGKSSMTSRDVPVLPVALSMVASLVASPIVLGTPVEIYSFGTMFSYLVIGAALGLSIGTYLFMNAFYEMKVISVYEYAEKRFCKVTRRLMTLVFAISMIIYMGIIVYSPSIALESVTGLDNRLAILIVGVIGTVYTSIGGLKGLIWVDVIQMAVLISAFIGIITQGTIKSGGAATVWKNNIDGGRFIFDEFDPDPRTRTSFWTQVVGGFVFVMNMVLNQANAQKLLTLPTKRKMHGTVFVTIILVTIFWLAFVGAGVVMYAYYKGCDPLALGLFRPDQFVPIFTMKIFEDHPGFTGLLVAAVFAASLSTVAAGINALSAVTILDLINPLYQRYKGGDIMQLRPSLSMLIFKSLAVFYGLLTIALAYLAQVLGQSLLQMALSLLGIVGGPMLACFVLGMFVPFANRWGAMSGFIVSLGLTFWVAIGSIATGAGSRTMAYLNLTRAECPDFNKTYVIPTRAPPPDSFSPFEDFYRMSYMWYSLFSCLICIIVGMMVSLATGMNGKEGVDPGLLHPFIAKRMKPKKKATDESSGSPPPPYTVGMDEPKKSNLSNGHDNIAYADDSSIATQL